MFTMDELVRLPSVSRPHYIECVVNRPTSEGKTVEQMHGMVACSEWTGVPLAALLDEVGVEAGANWVFAEGAESIRLGASLPLGKAMDDVIVCTRATRCGLSCPAFRASITSSGCDGSGW